VIGGILGALAGAGLAVGVAAVVSRQSFPVVSTSLAVLALGTIGAQLGSGSPMPVWEHQVLMRLSPVCCALAGFFLGVYLVHGMPAKGEFGIAVVSCCALFAVLGVLVPLFVLSRLVPVFCPRCKGRAYLCTDSTFLKKMLATYAYRCRTCEHAQQARF
jgi:hypothetical protein